MKLEDTIRQTIISEAADLDGRLQQLVRAGLMPSNTLPLLRRAITKMQSGMTLQGPERDVMSTFINSMMFIVLGDDAIFNRARVGAKGYAAEEVDIDALNNDTLEEGQKPYVSASSGGVGRSAGAHVLDSAGNTVKSFHKKEHGSDYMKKANVYLKKNYNKMMKNEATVDTADIEKHKMISSKDKSKIASISAMMAKEKKPVKEDSEQIDELSNDTLRRYRMKAKSIADHGGEQRTKGRELAGRKSYGGRMTGIEKAKVMAKEEVESIDELSKDTMGRYIKKAADRMSTQGVTAGLKIAKDERSQKNFDTISKRAKGISTAVKKLTKESRKTEALADISAIKQMNESYKTTFDAALEQYGIKSPSELDENTRKEFFNFVDQEYKKGDK